MHETVTMLKLFEKDCMETYVAQEAKTKENSIDERLAVLEKKWVNWPTQVRYMYQEFFC